MYDLAIVAIAIVCVGCFTSAILGYRMGLKTGQEKKNLAERLERYTAVNVWKR